MGRSHSSESSASLEPQTIWLKGYDLANDITTMLFRGEVRAAENESLLSISESANDVFFMEGKNFFSLNRLAGKHFFSTPKSLPQCKT